MTRVLQVPGLRFEEIIQESCSIVPVQEVKPVQLMKLYRMLRNDVIQWRDHLPLNHNLSASRYADHQNPYP